jgi:hypothetical protein
VCHDHLVVVFCRHHFDPARLSFLVHASLLRDWRVLYFSANYFGTKSARKGLDVTFVTSHGILLREACSDLLSLSSTLIRSFPTKLDQVRTTMVVYCSVFRPSCISILCVSLEMKLAIKNWRCVFQQFCRRRNACGIFSTLNSRSVAPE